MTARKKAKPRQWKVWLARMDIETLNSGGAGIIYVNETFKNRGGKFATLTLNAPKPKKPAK